MNAVSETTHTRLADGLFDPFRLDIAPVHAVGHRVWQNALERALEAMLARPGLVLLLGGPGSGKTLLLGELESRLRALGHDVRRFSHDTLDPPEAADGPGERFVLIDGARLHAQVLGALPPSDGLRCLVAELPVFYDRVAELPGSPVVVWLPAMAPSEARAFVAERMNQAGWSPDLLTEEALALLIAGAGGVPQNLCHLVASALRTAAVEGAVQVGYQHIARAMEEVTLVGLRETPTEAQAAKPGRALRAPILPTPSATRAGESNKWRVSAMVLGFSGLVASVLALVGLGWVASGYVPPEERGSGSDVASGSSPAGAAPQAEGGPARPERLASADPPPLPPVPVLQTPPPPSALVPAPVADPPPQRVAEPPPPLREPASVAAIAPVPPMPADIAQAAPPAAPPAAISEAEPAGVAASNAAPSDTTATDTAPPAPADPPPALAVDPAPPPAAAISAPRIVISYARRDPEGAARGRALAERLRRAGFLAGDPIPVARVGHRPELRVFFAEDQMHARQLREALGATAPVAELVKLPARSSLPRPGTLELVLPASAPLLAWNNALDQARPPTASEASGQVANAIEPSAPPDNATVAPGPARVALAWADPAGPVARYFVEVQALDGDAPREVFAAYAQHGPVHVELDPASRRYAWRVQAVGGADGHDTGHYNSSRWYRFDTTADHVPRP